MAKKQEHCDPRDPADEQKGDWWDHKGYDPEHRLVVSVVPGARNGENAEEVVAEFKRRTGGRPMDLITSDEPALPGGGPPGVWGRGDDDAQRPAGAGAAPGGAARAVLRGGA